MAAGTTLLKLRAGIPEKSVETEPAAVIAMHSVHTSPKMKKPGSSPGFIIP
ncbi:hypothetical protein [Agrobacterium burrii]|uniref:Uncharacterized protein n=1 Tax=Agrobacterium burrii TaxID=2815339 RepID=A0ABS3EJR0_9HYPH|nr:hypothetical protein [Agrobacterium burrii]MBO0132176.1 hypothetical protein [Agrobacterium burrii]